MFHNLERVDGRPDRHGIKTAERAFSSGALRHMWTRGFVPRPLGKGRARHASGKVRLRYSVVLHRGEWTIASISGATLVSRTPSIVRSMHRTTLVATEPTPWSCSKHGMAGP